MVPAPGSPTAPAVRAASLDDQLLMAVRGNEMDHVHRLLTEAGADANARLPAEYGGGTALMVACLSGLGNESILWLLLKAGADVNTRDAAGRTALLHAASVGNNGYVRVLVEQGADARLAAEDGTTALHVAAERGDVKLARYLLDRCGCAVDAATADGGLTPLALTAGQGTNSMAELLLAYGASVDGVGTPPLLAACEAGDLQLAKLLLARGADPGRLSAALNGIPPLFKAVDAGSVPLVTLLLANGAPVDGTDRDGRTLLSHLCELGSFPGQPRALTMAFVEQLLAAGADPTRADANGATPLAYARQHPDSAELLTLLLRRTRQLLRK